MAHKILIIEDDRDMIEAVKLRLVEEGYEVVTAENGLEGLEKYEADKPNLILLDVVMPQMDGYSFIKTFKQKYSVREVPVIVLSGKSGMKDMFALEGIRGFLEKPYGFDELLQKIKNCLR